MKQYRKRIALGLCMAACLLLITACGRKSEEQPLEESEQQYLIENAQGLLEQIAGFSDEDIQMILEQAALMGNEEGVEASAMESWKGIKDDVGGFGAVKKSSVEQTDSGYTVSVQAKFENRDMEFVVGMDKQMANLTFMSFNPVYTIGEKMGQAGMNTLLGMGTVFVVLVFISLLIGCFKYINRFEQKMKRQAGNEVEIPVPVAVPVSPSVKPEENLMDDCELVAVITAAVAASAGSSPSGLVVRSIRRASSPKWKKA